MPAPRTIAAPTIMTPGLNEFLRKLAQEEQTATGSARRPAFRLTRIAIAAALANHIAAHQLAQALDTSVGAVRSRVTRVDAELTPARVRELTGLTPTEIRERAQTDLTPTPTGNYLVSDIVRALLST